MSSKVALSLEKSKSKSRDAGSKSELVDWMVRDGSGVYRCRRTANAVRMICEDEVEVFDARLKMASFVLVSSGTVLIASTSLFGAAGSGSVSD